MGQLKVYYFILCVLNCLIYKSQAETVCDTLSCEGPIRYYEELNCKPIFATPGSCCPYQYDCNHLALRSSNKCYIRNNVYNIGDDLAKYDTNPCDNECSCRKPEQSGRATFHCSVVDCPTYELQEGCYLHRNFMQCCPEVVCPQDDTRIWCVVNGKSYMNGEKVILKSSLNETCQCQIDDSNRIAEIRCDSNQFCNSEVYFPYSESCVPIYFPNDSPKIDCSFIYRCYNQDDQIVKHSLTHMNIENKATCKFGDLTLEYGDQLALGMSYDTCMNCTCEVGPMLTCRRFSVDFCEKYLQ